MSKNGTRRGNNEGSITKRQDGTYQGSVLFGYCPETGKQIRKYYYSKKKGDVQKWIDEMRSQSNNTINYGKAYKITVAVWFRDWLENWGPSNMRPTTYDLYTTQIEKHIIPRIGHLKLTDLNTIHLQELIKSKEKGGRLDGREGGLSPKSIKILFGVINSCLKKAVNLKMLPYNPAVGVELPKYNRPEPKFWDVDQLKSFLTQSKDSKHYEAFRIMLETGVRRGELLALRVSDVDLDNNQITINQGLVRVKGLGLTTQQPKTELSKRTIDLTPEGTALLKKVIDLRNFYEEEAGNKYRSDLDLVFCNENGEYICPRSFSRVFERIVEKTGITEKLSIHGLRHTYASIARQEGVDFEVIQKVLGHYCPAFTLQYYGGITKKMKREATDKVGRLITSLSAS